MDAPTIIKEAASVANVINVVVIGVGYYFLIKLYREWVHQRQEARAAGGRPQVVVAADYGHLPDVSIVVRNFTKAPAREVTFEFSAPLEDPNGCVLSELPYFKRGLDFLEPEGRIACYWGELDGLASMLRQKGLEGGIRVTTKYEDLAGESYETGWNLNPLLFESGRIENYRDMNDLVKAVENISEGHTSRNGRATAASDG